MTLRAVHRALIPALIGLVVLAGCETTTTPQMSSSESLRSASAVSAELQSGKSPTWTVFVDKENFAPPGGWAAPTGPTIDCQPLALEMSFQQTYLGSGTMTHIGRVTSTATWTSCVIQQNGGLIAYGTGTYTLGDGCEIYVSFVQTFAPMTVLNTSNFTMTGQITGGTGHYAGATGYLSGVGQRVGVVGSWVITGVVDVPRD